MAKKEFIRRVHKRMEQFGTQYSNAWQCSLCDPANAELVNEMQQLLPGEDCAPDGTCAVLGLTPGDAAETEAAYSANGRTLGAVNHKSVFSGLVDYHVGKGLSKNAAIGSVRARHPILTRAVDAINAAGK